MMLETTLSTYRNVHFSYIHMHTCTHIYLSIDVVSDLTSRYLLLQLALITEQQIGLAHSNKVHYDIVTYLYSRESSYLTAGASIRTRSPWRSLIVR